MCPLFSENQRPIPVFFVVKKRFRNITRQILNFILEVKWLKSSPYCVVLIQIKFSWLRKSHFELNIIRDEIWIMNFSRSLFFHTANVPVGKQTVDEEITMVILWWWHETSISNILWRHGLERQKKKKKKKKKTFKVMSTDREVLIKARHGC